MKDTLPVRERQREVLTLLRQRGQLEVTAAARLLAVAPETLRRDLRVLEEHGLVQRNYGVAYPRERAGFETDLEYREHDHVPEKRRIAARAALHLDDADSVFVDEGYLPQLLAEQFPPDRMLTVITGSLPVAMVLAPRPNYTVIMLGGVIRGRTLATVEDWTTKMLGQFAIDLAYIGANGITLKDGLTTPDLRVAAVKAAAVASARRRIFIGGSYKFGNTSFCKFADVADFEMIITDLGLPASVAQRYAAAGTPVVRI